MSSFRPPLQPRSVHPPPAELQAEIDRNSWLDLAGILLLLVGFFNIIDGVAAISDSSYLTPHVVFSNLHAWGWFFLIVGIVQIIAGWAVMQGAGWAAIVGMLTAFVNAIAQLSAAHTFEVWALLIVAIDVLVIYGLARYGGGRGRAA